MAINPLPVIRRVVTSHDEEGNAKVWMDEEVENKSPPGFTDGVSFGMAWVTDSSPADCQTVKFAPLSFSASEDLELTEVFHRPSMAGPSPSASSRTIVSLDVVAAPHRY